MHSPRWSRRDLLRMAPGTLLALGLWPGALAARDAAAGDFAFVVLNDLHYFNKACGDWLTKVVAQIKALPQKVELCLIAGDLAEHGTAAQVQGARDVFATLGTPVKVVIGNHDYRNDRDRKPFEAAYPDSINYQFEHRGWRFVGLDSSHGLASRVAVQPPTLRWLDDHLPKMDAKAPLVVLTHFPLGAKVPNTALNANAVLNRFKGHNLKAVYSGHNHGFTERKVGDAVLTTNVCCSRTARNHDGTTKKGFFVCEAKDGVITRTFVEVKPT